MVTGLSGVQYINLIVPFLVEPIVGSYFGEPKYPRRDQ